MTQEHQPQQLDVNTIIEQRLRRERENPREIATRERLGRAACEGELVMRPHRYREIRQEAQEAVEQSQAQ